MLSLTKLKKLINSRNSSYYILTQIDNDTIICNGFIAVIISEDVASQFEKQTKLEKKDMPDTFKEYIWTQNNDSIELGEIECKGFSCVDYAIYKKGDGERVKVDCRYIPLLELGIPKQKRFDNKNQIEVIKDGKLVAIIMPMRINEGE